MSSEHERGLFGGWQPTEVEGVFAAETPTDPHHSSEYAEYAEYMRNRYSVVETARYFLGPYINNLRKKLGI